MALGRGLDALLGDSSLHAREGGSVTLPISQVEPGLNQPRKHFDEDNYLSTKQAPYHLLMSDIHWLPPKVPP